MVKAYLANGLFSLGDRMLNDHLAKLLRLNCGIEVYVPQENDEINDKSNFADSKEIAAQDCYELLGSDFVVAVLDGSEIDSGVAAEIGIAFARQIPVIGLITDIRLNRDRPINDEKVLAMEFSGEENQFLYRNLFVIGLIKNGGGVIIDDLNQLPRALETITEGKNLCELN